MSAKRLPPPDDAEVTPVALCIARLSERPLERRGLGPRANPEEADPLRLDQPLVAELYSASVQRRVALGWRAGHRLAALEAWTASFPSNQASRFALSLTCTRRLTDISSLRD